MKNWWTKDQLRQVLQSNTGMRQYQVDALVEKIAEIMERRRLILVPTYLSDEMFDAQREIDPNIEYLTASKLYRAALDKHDSFSNPPVIEPEEGGFW